MKKLVSVLIVTALLVTAFALPVNATLLNRMFGDVIADNEVNVMDSTEIQRHCAKLVEFDGLRFKLADFNNDADVNVLDATSIQLYSAKLIENPRFDNEYLDVYVEIEDIDIKPYTGTPLLANKTINFTVLFDDVYNPLDDKYVRYDYTFTGITDKTYNSIYEDIRYSQIGCRFPSAGIYEIEVEVYKSISSGGYTYTKTFEVLPSDELDQKCFVDYTKIGSPFSDPTMPSGVTEVAYKIEVDSASRDLKLPYGYSTKSSNYVALINSKEDYDALLEIDNTVFDEEFFEEKSLVVAVTLGGEYYDLAPITGVAIDEEIMYIRVNAYNNSPFAGQDPPIEVPMETLWYSFVSVDKTDVEHITSVQRVR